MTVAIMKSKGKTLAQKKNSRSVKTVSGDAERTFGAEEIVELMLQSYWNGRVNMMFDMAMEMLESRCSSDNMDTVRGFVSWCLDPKRGDGFFEELEYELWCMMSCITGVQ